MSGTRSHRAVRRPFAFAAVVALIAGLTVTWSIAGPAEKAGAASATTMDVVVKKRTMANPSVAGTIGADVTGTNGAVFELYTFTNQDAGPGAATGYTCTITAGGECTISVPNANSSNANRRFWVVETTPGAGNYSNPLLLVGSYTGPTGDRRIVGVTKATTANTTQDVPMTATSGTGQTPIAAADLPSDVSTGQGASYGAVAGSLVNPTMPPSCTEPTRPRIAMVLDESASISSTQWTTFRNAITGTNGLLSTLAGTNAAVSVLGFGSTPLWHYGQSGAVAVNGNQTAIANSIPTTRPGGTANTTNWDAALRTIATVNPTNDYDLVLFITDGAPNTVGTNGSQVSGYDVTTRSVEAAIFSANAIKNQGVRVISVGVGAGINGAGVNLRAVSGQQLGRDYYQTGDWSALQQQLTDIAKLATCQVPITVTKTTVDGTVTTTNAGGFTFGATKTGDGTLQGTASQTTTAGGNAAWTLRFTQVSGQTGAVTLSETLQSGWTLTGAECNGTAVPLNADGRSITVSGITTTSHPTGISCTFRNVKDTFGSLQISKVVSGPGGYTGPSTRPFPVAYSCVLNGSVVRSGSTDVTTGTPRVVGNIPTGAVCSFTETLTTATGDFPTPTASYGWSPPGVFSPTTVTIGNGTTVGTTVTNTYVRQYGKLTLAKAPVGAGYLGTGEPFTVRYVCGTVTGSVTLASGGQKTIDLPAAASCQLTEDTPAASLLDVAHVWGTPIWGAGGATVNIPTDGSTATRTVTNPTTPIFGTVTVTKRIQGGGAVAGTAFRISISCSDGTTTVQDLAADATWTSGNLPVGTTCQVSETSPTGGLVDDSYAWGPTPAAQSVQITAAGQVVPVTVTNTTTRVYGGLAITKQLTAPTGVVDPSRTYAIDWSCTYGADAPVTGTATVAAGVPWTAPADSILLGSVCTVTEQPATLTAGPNADTSYVWVGVPAAVVVTVTKAAPQPTATVTNVVTRATGTFTVGKTVTLDGQPGGFTGSFDFTWSCTDQGGNPAGTGTFSLVHGGTFNGPAVPVGSSCTVEETGVPAAPADHTWGTTTTQIGTGAVAGSRSATFTADGSVVSVAFVNPIVRSAGAVVVSKTVTGETGGLVAGSSFPITLNCGPAGTVTVDLTDGGSATVPSLPLGTTCTVNEGERPALADASYTWGTPVITPATVTVTGETQSAVVENPITRVTAPLTLTKTLGDAIQGVVPADKAYTGTWSCSYLDAPAGSGTWSATAGQTVTLADDVLVTADCSAVENDLGAAAVDPSYRWQTPVVTGTTVTAAGPNTITVQNTLVRDVAALELSKVLAGAVGGYTGGDEENFTVQVSCTVPGQPTLGPIVRQVTLAAGGTGSIDDLPQGWSCAVTEQTPTGHLADSSYTWGAVDITPATVVVDAEPAAVTVTNTINRLYGDLQITKVVADSFGAVPVDATFTGTWSCRYGTDDVVTGDWTITGATGGTVSAQTGGADARILLGSSCWVTETSQSALINGSYSWQPAAVSHDEQNPLVVEGAGEHTLTVTNTTQRVWAALSLSKTVQPAVAGDPTGLVGGATFTGQWSCTLGLESWAGTFTVADGQTASLFTAQDQRVPATASCEVTENAPGAAQLVDGSFGWDAPASTTSGTATLVAGENPTVYLTNVTRRVLSQVQVDKQVSGPAATLVDPDRSYTGTLSCTHGTDPAVERTWSAKVGTPGTVTGILVGSLCRATEDLATLAAGPVAADPSYEWDVVAAPSGETTVAAPTSPAASITIVNPTRRVTTTFTVTKKVTGATGGISDPAPVYPVGFQCVPGTGAAIEGSFSLAADGTGTSPTVPVGSNCTVTEGTTMPALQDAAWTWEAPVLTVVGADSTPTERGTVFTVPAARTRAAVTVTNTVAKADGGWTLAKTADPVSGTPVAPGGSVTYTLTVTVDQDSVPVHDVVVTDDLTGVDAHATLPTSFTPSAGTATLGADGLLTWTLPTTAEPGEYTLSYTVVVDDDAFGQQLRNAVTGTGDTPPDACTPEIPCSTTHPVLEPATVAKELLGATQNPATGVWTIRYRLIVSNPNALGSVPYDLSDTSGFAPGVTVSAVSVSAPAGVDTVDGFNGADQPQLVTGGSVPPSGHVFEISVLAVVPASVPDADRVCDPAGPGHGWFNLAELTSFGAPSTDDACAPIDPPVVPTVVKTAATPVQLAGGNWQVGYTVTVTNPSGTAATSYNLSDTFGFGTGVTVVGTPTVTGPAGVSLQSGWNGADQPVVAAAVVLPANVGGAGVHTYQVSAVVAVAATATPSARDCVTDGTETGTGFLNRVSLTVGDRDPVVDEACAQPVSPVQVKRPGTARQTAAPWDGTWLVDFSIDVSNPSSTTALRYTLTDTPDFAAGVEIVALDGVTGAEVGEWTWADGTLSVVERELAAGTTDTVGLTFRVRVADTVPTDPAGQCSAFHNNGLVTSGNDSFPVEACVPYGQPPVPSIVKDVVGHSQNPDGSWTVDYTVTVTNPSDDVALQYDLADTPAFGAGITITDATVSYDGTEIDGWGPGSFGPVVTGRSLAPGAVDIYTVRITATVATTATSTDRDCVVATGENGTGFLNSATLTSGGQTRTDDACAAPVTPQISKSFVGTSQDIVDGVWTGTWLSDWVITVTNPTTVTDPATGSGAPGLVYTLTDTPQFPAGVTVSGVRVLSATAGDGSALDPTVTFADGTATLSPARTLGAGLSDTYTLQVAFTVADDKVVTESCDTADALVNRAVALSGQDAPAAEACGEVPQAPTPVVSKTVQSLSQGPDGLWTIHYDIAVTNPGTVSTRYTLSDTPAFGDGITISSGAVVQAPVGVDAAGWVAPTFGTLVENRSLAAGLTETYRIAVVAAVTVDSTPSSRDCTLDEGENGTGFLNVATVSGPGGGNDSSACTVPVLPEIVKDAVSIEPASVDPSAEPGTYRATYRVTVSNTDPSTALSYSVLDELTPPAGVTLSDRSVSAVVTDLAGNPVDGTVPVDLSWTGSAPTTSLTAGSTPLAAGTRHVFTVAVTATVAPETTELSCGDGGLGNRAEVTSGGISSADDACLDLPVRMVLHKVWDINGVEYQQGEQPAGFEAAATLQDNDLAWGEVVDGLEPNSTVVVGERVVLPSARCSNSSSGLGDVLLDRALVEVTVVNTVDCENSLTVVKQVLSRFGGQASADRWTVTAHSGESQITGAGTATGAVATGSTWTLSESGGPAGWEQAGPWTCTDSTGTGSVFGADQVTVGFGSAITCVVTNTDYQVDLAVDIQHSKVGLPDDHDVVLTAGLAGQTYDYVITVSNVGDRPATATTLTNQILDFLTVDPDSIRVNGLPLAGSGWTVTLPGRGAAGRGGTFTAVHDGPFAPGEVAVFTFTVQVGTLPGDGVPYPDVVEVARVSSLEPDANPADNIDDDALPVIVQVLPTTGGSTPPPPSTTPPAPTTPTPTGGTSVTATTAPNPTTGPVPSALPNTGFAPAGFVIWALLLVGAGALVLALGRRRRTARHG